MCIFMRVCLCFKDGAATAEDVTYADLTLAGMADRKWETENEDTVYAGIQPIGRDNVWLALPGNTNRPMTGYSYNSID